MRHGGGGLIDVLSRRAVPRLHDIDIHCDDIDFILAFRVLRRRHRGYTLEQLHKNCVSSADSSAQDAPPTQVSGEATRKKRTLPD